MIFNKTKEGGIKRTKNTVPPLICNGRTVFGYLITSPRYLPETCLLIFSSSVYITEGYPHAHGEHSSLSDKAVFLRYPAYTWYSAMAYTAIIPSDMQYIFSMLSNRKRHCQTGNTAETMLYINIRLFFRRQA